MGDYGGGWRPIVREPFSGAWQRNQEWTTDSVLAREELPFPNPEDHAARLAAPERLTPPDIGLLLQGQDVEARAARTLTA